MVLFSFKANLQRNGRVVIPAALHAQLGMDAASLTIALTTSTGAVLHTLCSVSRSRAMRGGKERLDLVIQLPIAARAAVKLPCSATIVVESLHERSSQIMHPVGGAARFDAVVRDHKMSVYFDVPAAWYRGLAAQGWCDVRVNAVQVRTGSLVTFDATLRLQHADGAGRTDQCHVSVPAELARGLHDGESLRVELRELRFTRPVLDRLYNETTFDWAAVVPAGALLADDGPNRMVISSAYSNGLSVRRHAPAMSSAWLLGLYQAEGDKEGGEWAFFQKAPQVLRDVASALRGELGVPAERLYLRLSLYNYAHDYDQDEVRGLYERVVGQPVKIIGKADAVGFVQGQLVVEHGGFLQDMFNAALCRLIDHELETATSDFALAFALGFLDGDGTIVIGQRAVGLSIRLGLSGDERELTATMRLLERGLGWRYSKPQFEDNGISRFLTLDEAIGLATAGAFRYNLARARLLYAIDQLADLVGYRHERLDEIRAELRMLSEYVSELDDAITGIKGIPYPLSEHGEDSIVQRQRVTTVGAQRQRASRVSHQRRMREEAMAADPQPPLKSLTGAYVQEIAVKDAKAIIMRYEWLRSMGSSIHAYALFSGRKRHDEYSVGGIEVLGVACFGHGPGAHSKKIVTDDALVDRTMCLERGACVHWAPKNAASFLIREATKAAARDHGWCVFFAYADEEAGEIGTVYQAANWLYIGKGPGRSVDALQRYRRPDGSLASARAMRLSGRDKADALLEGWQVVREEKKHKYVWFDGSPTFRAKLKKMCRFPPQAYPKRALSLEQ